MRIKYESLLLLVFLIVLACVAVAESSAQTGGGKAPAGEASEPVGSVSALAGKWTNGSIGRKTWTYTGSYADPNGDRVTYLFSPDGSVVYVGLTQYLMGECFRQTTTSKKGRASLDGDTLTIRWGRGFTREDVTCMRTNTSTKTFSGETETLKVAFKKSSEGKKQLCAASKYGENCYSAAE